MPSGYANAVRKFTALKAHDPILQRQIDATVSNMTSANVPHTELTYTGDVAGIDTRNIVVKPRMPDFLYRPMYGRPRNINIPEINRLANTPTAAMCIKTIIDEVTSLDWVVRMKDPEARSNDTAIDEVTEKLENPNRNKENFKIILKKNIRDILRVDAGLTAKIYDRASYYKGDPNQKLLPLGRRRMAEFHAYDGGTFTMNPNMHGILPDQHAYYQYNFHHQAMPTPFARDEIIYMMSNPRTDNMYGISPMQIAYDVIRYEVFGVTAGIDHFTRNEIPKGIISLLDANKSHIEEFQARIEDKVNIQDPMTNEMRYMTSKIPVTNQEVKFTPLQVSPETVRLLETQQWYIKVIFACFGVTPSELGFTESSNRATELVQSEVFRRKAVLPMLDTLEYYYNRELIPEFGYDDLCFEFIRTDIQNELRDQELTEKQLKSGQITINEWRADQPDLEPVEWGDKPYKGGGFGNDMENGMRSMMREKEGI